MYYLGPGYSYVPEYMTVYGYNVILMWNGDASEQNSMYLAIKMNIQVIKRTKVNRNYMSLELTVVKWTLSWNRKLLVISYLLRTQINT